jgi:pimeloyl-ACP methyl ester carboxylesterase
VTRVRPVAAAASAGAAAALWFVARERDRRAVERDPEHALLFEPPVPRDELAVRSGDGTTLHVERFGDAQGPPIILVHGWTCGVRFWTHQIRDLAQHHRVIAYDLRGHGRSEAPRDRDFSVDALAADLEAVLEATLDPGERALVVGHSLGAMTIVAWAGRSPEAVPARAAGVALLNAGLGDLISESLIVRAPSALGRARGVVGRLALGVPAPLPRSSPITNRAVRYIALSPAASPAQAAFCEELALRCPRDVRAGCGRSLSTLDLTDAAEHVTVPTLVMAGADDRLTPPTHADQLARLLPDCAGVERLQGVGHMAPVEAREPVNVALRDFAARVLAARATAAYAASE